MQSNYLANAKPICEVLSIGQSSREPNDAQLPASVAGDKVCARHDNFKDWTTILSCKTLAEVNNKGIKHSPVHCDEKKDLSRCDINDNNNHDNSSCKM